MKKFITTSKKPFFAYVGVYNPHPPPSAAPQEHVQGLEGAADPLVRREGPHGQTHRGAPPDAVSKKESDVWDELYRNRLRSLQSVDDMIGDLITTLRDTGKLDNTYFIYTSDNGFHIGHTMPRARTPATRRTHTSFVVRGSQRPPDAACPHRKRRHRPDDRRTGGASAPAFVDGRSLELTGAPSSWRQVFLLEHGPGTTRNRPPAPSNPRTTDPVSREVLPRSRTGSVTTTSSSARASGWTTKNDPYELHNLAVNAPANQASSRNCQRVRKMRAAPTCVAEGGRGLIHAGDSALGTTRSFAPR